MYLKLFCFTLLFTLITIPLLITIYSDLLLNRQSFITLNPDSYPEIQIDLQNQFKVPHIYSETLQGSLYGLGYMHAKDRLWQMELKRLVSYGQLSEVFGEEVLFLDKYFRTLGLLDVCRKNIEYIKSTDQETYNNMVAYSDGVNYFIATERANKMPIEFILLGAKFQNWTALDCLMLTKFAFVNLIVDWQAELFRSKLADFFKPHEVEELFPGRTKYQYDRSMDSINDDELKQSGLYKEYTENVEEILFQNKGELKGKIGEKLGVKKGKFLKSLYEILNPGPGFKKGSNTWVVHGNHTKSGKPILAADVIVFPHLDNNVPSIWYLAELKYLNNNKEHYVIGATMSGIPFVVFGRTQYLAWSGAIAIGDNSDAFEEVLNKDETQYFFNGEYHDLIIKNEIIKIKGQEPYNLTVKKTRHGPLVKYFLSDVAARELWLNRDYSFAWAGFMDKEKSLASFYNLYKIDSWQPKQIVQAGTNLSFTSISLNIATNDGHILAIITSAWLKKQDHSPAKDFFPKDGTDPSNEWLGLIDPMEKPYIIDPPKGYIFQANNKFASDGYKYQTASNYIATARGSRINELLEQFISRGQKITIQDMMKMQQDTIDIYARDMVVKMVGIVEGLLSKFNENEQRGLKYFCSRVKEWNANHDINSIEATLYDTWQYLFRAHLLMFFENQEDAIAIQHIYQFEQYLMHQITKWNHTVDKIFQNQAEPTLDICPQVHYSKITNEYHLKLVQEHCAYLLPITLLMTKDYLVEELGNDINTWQWGNLHQNRYLHIPFSAVPILREIYERTSPGYGNINTINCGVANFKNQNFDSQHGPNFRMISEMNGDLYQIIDTGQNENVFSENYFDQAELFQKGEFIKMEFGNFQARKN